MSTRSPVRLLASGLAASAAIALSGAAVAQERPDPARAGQPPAAERPAAMPAPIRNQPGPATPWETEIVRDDVGGDEVGEDDVGMDGPDPYLGRTSTMDRDYPPRGADAREGYGPGVAAGQAGGPGGGSTGPGGISAGATGAAVGGGG